MLFRKTVISGLSASLEALLFISTPEATEQEARVRDLSPNVFHPCIGVHKS